MANSCRIDGLHIDATTGAVQLDFTFGPPPLSPIPSGQGAAWPNVTEFSNEMAALEDLLTPTQHALLALINYTKVSGDIQLRNSANIKGKTVTVDLAAGGAAMVVSQ